MNHFHDAKLNVFRFNMMNAKCLKPSIAFSCKSEIVSKIKI